MRIYMKKQGIGFPPTGVPIINGEPLEGSALTIDTSGIVSTSGIFNVSYQWYKDEAPFSTAASILLGSSDVGAIFRAEVTYLNGYNTEYTISTGNVGPIRSADEMITRELNGATWGLVANRVFNYPGESTTLHNKVAEVVGISDGSQISANSTQIAGGVYLGRDFWTYSGLISGHGALNGAMSVTYDAGVNKIWDCQGDFTALSGSGTYPYLANFRWYVSDDNATWTLICEGLSNNIPSEEITASFSGVSGRYLRIQHDLQPLNTYQLSVAKYENLNVKIVEQTTVTSFVGQASDNVQFSSTTSSFLDDMYFRELKDAYSGEFELLVTNDDIGSNTWANRTVRFGTAAETARWITPPRNTLSAPRYFHAESSGSNLIGSDYSLLGTTDVRSTAQFGFSGGVWQSFTSGTNYDPSVIHIWIRLDAPV